MRQGEQDSDSAAMAGGSDPQEESPNLEVKHENMENESATATVAEEEQPKKESVLDLGSDKAGTITEAGFNTAASGDVAEIPKQVKEASKDEEDEQVESQKEGGGDDESGSVKEADKEHETPTPETKGVEKSAEAENVKLVRDATKLMEKLEIGESSEGGSSGGGGDDDQSSSMDSTANSGPRQPEGEEAVGEESLEGGTERPKKRIDLQHQFVRGIVKIQYDRDQYEKQCQTKKQEELKDRGTASLDSNRADSNNRRSSRASSRTVAPKKQEASKRQYSSPGKGGMRQKANLSRHAGVEDSQDQQQTSRNKSDVYRPPSVRNNTENRNNPDRPRFSKEGEGSPENLGIRITFDTERQRRSIQLSKPTLASGKGESNFMVTFDTAKKERHIETSSPVRPQHENLAPVVSTYKSKDSGELPSSFEFKATAVGKEQNGSSPTENAHGRRTFRGSGRFKGPKPLMLDIGTIPRRAGDKDGSSLVVNSRKGEDVSPTPAVNSKKGEDVSPTPELPLKSKPFASEVKWSDMVESESEGSPMANLDNPSSSSTPDVLESNQWKTPNNNNSSNSRRRGGSKKSRSKKKDWGGTPPFLRQQQQQTFTGTSSQALDSQNSGGTSRRSVWERLGPRPCLDRPPNFGSVQYEASTMENLRQMAERDYFCKEESESSVQAAYRDAKQKRTRLELYVPRRGGI